MASYHTAHLTEQLDAESPTHMMMPPRRRGRRLVAGVGVALALAGCIGVALGMARMRKPSSPLEHLSTLRKGLVKAFSSRALRENADLKADATFVWNEDGAEDPSAMGVNMVFKQSTDEHDGLAIKITFGAVKGKGADLVTQLKGVWDAVVEEARGPEGPGDEVADDLAKHVTVSAGEADDEAVIEITPPSSDEEDLREKDVKESINANTQFNATFLVGRSIAEMYEHKHTSVALLPKGIKASMHMQVAATIFNVITEGADETPPEVQMGMAVVQNLARYNMRQELFYKSEDTLEGGAFSNFPSLGEGIHQFAQMFFGQMPSKVRESLTGLDTVADGVKTVEVLGLPDKWEVIATCTNVHLAPLIKICLDEFPSEEA